MNKIKTIGCVVLIAGIGYFGLQSYKYSDIEKNLKDKFSPKPTTDRTVISIAGESQEQTGIDRITSLVWLKDNLVPHANDVSHPKPETKPSEVSKGYIFSSIDNKITIDPLTKDQVIDDIAATLSGSTTPASASLYTDIGRKIITFITIIKAKLDQPSSQEYRNYFKTFNQKLTLTSDESAIIDKLKGADEFYTTFLSALNSPKIKSNNTVASKLKDTFITQQNELRAFAKDYFNLTLPS